ncbi:MAG TPA: response regulator [Kofleriaceae bacterium]|jgi:CheY-like chemotaxis protein
MSEVRVLVVDDDLDVRTSLAQLLCARGFSVDLACDGGEAIEVLEHSAPPSAIVADLRMPGIVGNELLEYVSSRDELAEMPLAVVTGSPNLAPPGVRVFPKPIDFDALVAFLRTAVAR